MNDPFSILQKSSSAPSIPQGDFLDTNRFIDTLDIRPGMKVADFGCGTGHFTILLGQKVGKDGKILAVDVQEAPLESVRARAVAAGLANIETLRSDLEVLGGTGIPDGSQDAVLMANVLFQSSKKAEVIRESKRILKSGGRLILVEWGKGSGGFGPPDSMRTSQEDMQRLVTGEGLLFERTGDGGGYHYVLIFRK